MPSPGRSTGNAPAGRGHEPSPEDAASGASLAPVQPLGERRGQRLIEAEGQPGHRVDAAHVERRPQQGGEHGRQAGVRHKPGRQRVEPGHHHVVEQVGAVGHPAHAIHGRALEQPPAEAAQRYLGDQHRAQQVDGGVAPQPLALGVQDHREAQGQRRVARRGRQDEGPAPGHAQADGGDETQQEPAVAQVRHPLRHRREAQGGAGGEGVDVRAGEDIDELVLGQDLRILQAARPQVHAQALQRPGGGDGPGQRQDGAPRRQPDQQRPDNVELLLHRQAPQVRGPVAAQGPDQQQAVVVGVAEQVDAIAASRRTLPAWRSAAAPNTSSR